MSQRRSIKHEQLERSRYSSETETFSTRSAIQLNAHCVQSQRLAALFDLDQEIYDLQTPNHFSPAILCTERVGYRPNAVAMPVRMSSCLSVCLTRLGIMSKPQNLPYKFLHRVMPYYSNLRTSLISRYEILYCGLHFLLQIKNPTITQSRMKILVLFDNAGK